MGNGAVGRLLDSSDMVGRLDAGAVLALQRSSGNVAVGILVARDGDERPFPWIGRIEGASTVSLRRTPRKSADDPHRNTVADLDRGTQVRVVSAKGGWLRVEVKIGGEVTEGYVSHELITFVEASAFEVPTIEISVDVPTVPEAFVELKRAETKKAEGVFTPSQDEQDRLELGASVLEATGKYVVDQSTWKVDFKRKPGDKTQVLTIEDFILYVESVERAYPSASPMDVASEIRETWFADPNWAVMVASQGIRTGGKLVDIETKGPIPQAFDMKQIAPNKTGSTQGGLNIATPMGTVDMSHVMAGIDATLSGGMASSYPESFLEDREEATGDDYDTYKNTAVYDLLKGASGGDTRDFATWAGDLGQVYAEYILDRYIKKNAKATLASWTAQKMPREQLLGDIHGYVAAEIFKSVPAGDSPTGRVTKVSSILRDMYLVPKKGGGTFEQHFAKASKKKPSELADLIEQRTLKFARLWFAKGVLAFFHISPIRPRTVIGDYADKFDDLHASHKAKGTPEDQLDVLIKDMLKQLGAPVK